MIENGRLYRRTGAWTYVKMLAGAQVTGNMAWAVARADLGRPAFPASIRVVFQAALGGGFRLTTLALTHVFSASTGGIVVQGTPAKSGRHRVPIPDLVIATAAERAGLTVLHYDADFDTIPSVTGQPAEWVCRGSGSVS